jgi:hypothetical protein
VRHEPGLAEGTIQELNRRWAGREIDDALPPVVFQRVELASPATAWPPTVQFGFLLDGRPWLWELRLDVLDVASDPSAAADIFASVAFENLTEWRLTRGSPPPGRFAPVHERAS